MPAHGRGGRRGDRWRVPPVPWAVPRRRPTPSTAPKFTRTHPENATSKETKITLASSSQWSEFTQQEKPDATRGIVLSHKNLTAQNRMVQALPADWQMTGWFLLILGLHLILFKVLTLHRIHCASDRWRLEPPFVFSLHLAPKTKWPMRQPHDFLRVLGESAAILAIVLLLYWGYWAAVARLHPPEWVLRLSGRAASDGHDRTLFSAAQPVLSGGTARRCCQRTVSLGNRKASRSFGVRAGISGLELGFVS